MEKTMNGTFGRVPMPEEIARIEWEARRMRAEFIRSGAVALARAVRRVFARSAEAAPAPAARA